MADPRPRPSSESESAPAPRRTRRYSIATVLAVTLAALIVTAVGVVVLPLLYLGRDTTVALLRDKGDLALGMIELRVRQQMEPAASQLAFIADVLNQSGPLVYDRKRIADMLTGALSATPQIAALTFVDPDGASITALRNDDGVRIRTARMDKAALAARASRIGGWWSGVVPAPNGDVYIVREHAIWRDGKFIGQLSADVSARQLSMFLASVRMGLEANSFILYDHDYVLAHPRLTKAFNAALPSQVLPRLGEVDDQILSAIWNEPTRLPLLGHSTGSVRAVRIGDTSWIFIYREIDGYGDTPWTIGTYFRAVDVFADFRHLIMAGIGAALALVLAIVAAVWIGHRIARPIEQLARVARHLRGLRFSDVPALPRSSLRELDDQARAFEDMLGALRWFEAYVPRKLVRRLAQRRDRGPLPSVERRVTVMFTDIAGFTPMSERMSAVETAHLLNEHFELVTSCIEDQDGTVDKFIGDGAMAFWGALGRRQDQAERAARAAAAIADAIRRENRERADHGWPPIRLRIGIHTGPAVIGNIGSAGRVNYTIVGDTVNAAQRIEQLGREFLGERNDVVVLFSGSTERYLPAAIARTPVGTFTLRGRAEPVPVFRLVLPPSAQILPARAVAASDR
jgi:adenylate cyclase